MRRTISSGADGDAGRRFRNWTRTVAKMRPLTYSGTPDGADLRSVTAPAWRESRQTRGDSSGGGETEVAAGDGADEEGGLARSPKSPADLLRGALPAQASGDRWASSRLRESGSTGQPYALLALPQVGRFLPPATVRLPLIGPDVWENGRCGLQPTQARG